jgi:hypothetical protein
MSHNLTTDMDKGLLDVVDQLKRAIAQDDRSFNRLGRDAGIDPGQISRFVRGKRDLTLSAAGRVCRALGLELKPTKKGKRRPGRNSRATLDATSKHTA